MRAKTNTFKKQLVAMSALLLIGVAGAGCLGDSPGGGGGEDVDALKIGTVLPLTGDLAPYGPDGEAAVTMAINEINEAGGVNGQDVELAPGDSESNGNAANTQVNNLINVQNVHALVGAYSSGVTTAILDTAVNSQVPVNSPASTSPKLTEFEDDGYFFRVVPSDSLQGKVMAQLALDEGHLTAGVLAVNNDYGVGFAEVFEDYFGNNGGVVLNSVAYDPEGTTFGSDVDEATQGNPDVVVLISYPDTGSQILKQAYQKGKTDDITWLLSEGLYDQDFADKVGKTEGGDYIIAGMKGTKPVSQTADSFLTTFEDAQGHSPALFADGAYDAAIIYALASEYCDCVDGENLKGAMMDVMNAPGEKVTDVSTALEKAAAGDDIDYSGVAGDLDWNDQGEISNALYAVWQVQDDGSLTIIQDGITPPE